VTSKCKGHIKSGNANENIIARKCLDVNASAPYVTHLPYTSSGAVEKRNAYVVS
jgi:hypothetical protein